MDLIIECKKCMICSLLKPIRKECDPVKTRNDEQIHEYNFTCYKCLSKKIETKV